MTSYIPYLTLPDAIFKSPAASILLPVLAGTAVGYSNRPQETKRKYVALKQPPLRPPPFVFGPVWTALYGAMGYAAYLAFKTGTSSFNPATVNATRHGATLYTIQLGLNLIWMPLFFKYNKVVAATIDIVALTGVTSYLTYLWGNIDESAGWLLVPYVAWLSFATYLCAGCGYLNDWNLETKLKPASDA